MTARSGVPRPAWPASWPGNVRRPAGGAPGFTGRDGGDGGDGADGLARVLLTPTAPSVVPETPTDLAATPSADSQMALSWTAPATGTAVAGYRIERAVAAATLNWTVVEADTGNTDVTWSDSGLAAATTYHYRVTARSVVALGEPSAAAEGTTRPQLALLATAAYPLAARAWPLATAPATHTWQAHDTTVKLDVVARDAGGNWYRVLRFGERIRNVYWLPAAAVTVTGATAALPQAPGAPGDLAPPTATHETVTLTWSAPTTGGTVTGYRVWRQTGEEAFTIPGEDLAADVLTHTDTTVADSTAYQYRVQAVSAAGAGVRTPAVAVTTAATPREPGVPTAVTAAPGTDSPMVLTWTAPVDAGTQPVTGYRIERAAAATTPDWVEVASDTGTTDLTWSDSGLAAATMYHYRVRAHNAVGVGDPSAATSGTTRPQAALLATATYPLTAHPWPAATAPVSHTWSAHDASVQLEVAGQGAGGGGWYRVLRFGQGAGGPYWLPAAAVTVTGATANLPQVPGTPGDLRTTDLQGRVVLAWSAPTTGGTVTGYRLWRQTGEAAWVVLGDVLAADVLTHTDTGVTAGTTYRYRLQAQSAVGYGVRTAALSAVVAAPPVPPAVPAYAGAAQVAATTAQLFWDPVAAATGYEVEIRQSWHAADHAEARVRLPRTGTFTLQTGDATTATVTVARTGTLVELSGLPTGYAYWDLYVRAVNAGGASDWAEAYVYNDAANLYPRQPTGLRGRRTATGTATLSWTAVTGAADYRVYFDFPADDQGAAGWEWLPYRDATVAVSGTTATVSGLPATADSWGLRVTARNTNGDESVRSAAMDVSTATAPAAPTALRAAPGPDSQMQLAWTAPADAGTQPITGYRIERSADVDPRVWTDAAADTGGTATTWSDRGLAAATTHHYRVSARNSVGVGAPSEETSGTTRPQAALLATATYPLAARRWPAAPAPASHAWSAHDASVQLDVAGQVRGTAGWWRVLRFGAGADGPYWLPAAAVSVTGATTDVPEVPGTPTALTAAPGDGSSMELGWTAATAGGTATGYRIERSADVMPRVWTEVAADTGSLDLTWSDSGLSAATRYHYRVAGRNAAGPGVPSAEAAGLTRPQLTLLATAAYPLTAHRWPLATAPVSHTWTAHDATVKLEVLAQGAGGGGWYRVLRFGCRGGRSLLAAGGFRECYGGCDGPAPGSGRAGGLSNPCGHPRHGDPDLDGPRHGRDRDGLPPLAADRGGGFRRTRDGPGGGRACLRRHHGRGHHGLPVPGAGLVGRGCRGAQSRRVRDHGGGAPGPGGAHGLGRGPGRRQPDAADLDGADGYGHAADQRLSHRALGRRDTACLDGRGHRHRQHRRGLERQRPGGRHDLPLPGECPEPCGRGPALGGDLGDDPAAGGPAGHGRVSVDGAPVAGGHGARQPHLERARCRIAAGCCGTGSRRGRLVPGAALRGECFRALLAAGRCRDGHGCHRECAPGTGCSRGAAGHGDPKPGRPDLERPRHGGHGHGLPPLAADGRGGLGRAHGYPGRRRPDVHRYDGGHRAAAYQYRLQAEAEAGYGPRTAALAVTVTPPPPPDPTYFGAAQTAAATVDLAWDAVPGATGYDVEIRQSHGDPHVLVPQSGTFSLKTGETTSVTVTVVRTDTTMRLTGLPTGYPGWDLDLRATNAGGHSNWASASVANSPGELAPAPPTGLTGSRSAAGTASLGWSAVTGATAYRVYFLFPDDAQGAAGWDWLPHRGLTVTVTGTAATVGSLPTGATGWGLRVSAFNGNAESLVSTAVTVANSTS